VLCVLALLLVTAIGAARGSCRCAVALNVLAVVWLLANGPVEGPVLWSMDAQHGLTTADLLAIPYVLLGLRCLLGSVHGQRFLAQVRPYARVLRLRSDVTDLASDATPLATSGVRRSRLSGPPVIHRLSTPSRPGHRAPRAAVRLAACASL
jgi:hypothetical protein